MTTILESTADATDAPHDRRTRPVTHAARAARRCSTRPSCAAPSATAFVKLDPRRHGPQPGDVRGRDRQRAHHDPVLPGPAVGEPTESVVRRRWSPSWLWFTVLFANFAEAVAEGRGKAQADTLRKTPVRDDGQRAPARRHRSRRSRAPSSRSATSASSSPARSSRATATSSRASPAVDESAITGESAPVIRESGGDRSAVTGGTRVLSDEIVVRITARAGRDVPRPDDRAGRGRRAGRRPRTRSPSTSCWPGSPSSSCWPTVTLQPFAIYSGRRAVARSCSSRCWCA